MIKGQKMTEEQKKKISQAHKGKKKPWSGKYMTQSHKEAISKRMLGNKLCLGRKLSEQTVEKLRKSNIGKKHNISPEGKARMQVKNYDVWNKGMKGYNSGDKNSRWISDRTLLKKSHRQTSSAYSDWRARVYKRDRYKCQLQDENCFGKMEAHHILRWKEYPDLRYEVTNGITLCHLHHPRKREIENQNIEIFKKIISLNEQ